MTDIDSRLVALRARFKARLGEELDWFAGSAASQDSEMGSAERIAAIERSHKLCGISGSLGFTAVSDAARVLETSLEHERPQEEIAGHTAALLAALGEAVAI
ncbi:Hpt domain-containing protein [Croceicoccus bisphenolivorans]|uniref:Hpt domain-containing protein n=1 Tax=Croceicoccus bisphenolivorans TaxID=1783232 RepID=UPI00082F0D36|nr:Hpt domain-containing protein [Croceicoccus bisphenolivorans]